MKKKKKKKENNEKNLPKIHIFWGVRGYNKTQKSSPRKGTFRALTKRTYQISTF